MKITKSYLKRIIKEETAAVFNEGHMADKKWRDNPANPEYGRSGVEDPDDDSDDAAELYDIANDFERFADLPGYEDERVPGKTASQVRRRNLPPEKPKAHYRDDLWKYALEEGADPDSDEDDDAELAAGLDLTGFELTKDRGYYFIVDKESGERVLGPFRTEGQAEERAMRSDTRSEFEAAQDVLSKLGR